MTPADAKKSRAKGDADMPPQGENLDKIRDILFGSHARSTEQQLARLDKKLMKEAEDARAEAKKRFDSLEHYAKNELNSLNERLKAEQGDRMASDKELAATLAAAGKNFEKRLAELDERTSEQHRELRKQLLDQSKALRDEIGQSHRDMQVAMERAVAELRQAKADRFALADLFTELALRLKDEFKVSKSKG